MSAPRLVFVGGLHRSGTTALAEWMAEHPSVSGLVGTGVPHDEGQHLQDVVATAMEMGGPGAFARDRRAHLTEADAAAAPDARARLLTAWTPFAAGDALWIVEKSPPNLLRFRFLQAVFPDAAFVAIVRHPVAVALATQPWAGTGVGDLVDHWLGAHEQFERDRPHLDRLLFVRYEDLVADPAAHLDAIDRMLGLQPHARTIDVKQGTNDRYLRRLRHHRVLRRSLLPARLTAHFGLRLDRLGYGYRFTDRPEQVS